jgi:hypothetical protein
MSLNLLVAALAFLAGALVKHFFDRLSASSQHTRQLRTQAYVDFLAGTAKLTRETRQHPDGAKLLAAVADAKARICVYGSLSVVSALAALEATDLILSSPETKLAFLKIVHLMRQDSTGNSSGLTIEMTNAILFGKM